MPVDSFKYLPRLIAAFYQMTDRQPQLPIPWTPLTRPLPDCKFGLVTSGGLYHKGVEPPFDVAREKKEPTWGDPTYRTLPAEIRQAEVGASHLHLNTRDVWRTLTFYCPSIASRSWSPRGASAGWQNRPTLSWATRAFRRTRPPGGRPTAPRWRTNSRPKG